ncbi:hypothetical protein CFP56_031166 [Quercus suber]|uniref:Secreted protein n=1 Tax=Quercus suber TaxID=58331 RepID=A0AAW0JMJ5_QUESU
MKQNTHRVLYLLVGLHLRAAILCDSVLLIPDRVSTADHQLVMAPKRAKRGKSKATFEPEVSTTGDVPYEDMHGDPTAVVAKDVEEHGICGK